MKTEIKHSNLSEKAYKKIKSLILGGYFKNSEKIVQEKIAQKLGISRIPLISALSMLQRENLITYVPRRGYYIRKIQKDEFYNLIDIRISMECLAVRNIVKNMNPELEKGLLKFINQFIESINKKDSKRYYELDHEFHIFLIDKSENNYLKRINNHFNVLFLTCLKGFKTDYLISFTQHKKIVDSLIKKDELLAVKSIREHIEHKKSSHIL